MQCAQHWARTLTAEQLPAAAATSVEATGWWLKQGMQPVVPALLSPGCGAFVPCAGGLPLFLSRSCCQLGWDLPALQRVPCCAGVCSLAAACSGWQCWGRAWARSSAAWGAARAGEAQEGQRGSGGRPGARGESCRALPVARGLFSLTKQHWST